jgi:hypothetical protein
MWEFYRCYCHITRTPVNTALSYNEYFIIIDSLRYRTFNT